MVKYTVNVPVLWVVYLPLLILCIIAIFVNSVGLNAFLNGALTGICLFFMFVAYVENKRVD